MRYETPIFLGVVTVAAAFLDMLLFVPPAHCQQQVPIQSPAAHTQPVALATQSQTGVPARQSVASLSPPQATVAIQTKPGESRPALKNSDPLTAAMAAFPASLTTLARHEFETAFRKLPSFCHDWQTKLHEREINNLANLTWQEKSGYETAIYIGYGKVDGCLCKESSSERPSTTPRRRRRSSPVPPTPWRYSHGIRSSGTTDLASASAFFRSIACQRRR